MPKLLTDHSDALLIDVHSWCRFRSHRYHALKYIQSTATTWENSYVYHAKTHIEDKIFIILQQNGIHE